MTPDISVTSGARMLRVSRIDCSEIDEEDYYELLVNTRNCNDVQRFVFESESQAREFVEKFAELLNAYSRSAEPAEK